MTRGSMKTRDRAFINLQTPLLDVHPAMIRMAGMVMT